ncbi:hypothetical protein M011DRAFT_467638 [Sporormia fimetaria CBS 119925]|uniref:LEA domain-containing protein n=1 Tax=Sporormia fimetaria CBS 119925 TaxID=1340428 RepID=A0A6A6VAD7_9PLEO|nr:hypothetical protein M011DRAFT_467638 [Sporormia fimetaria CBS 119925]
MFRQAFLRNTAALQARAFSTTRVAYKGPIEMAKDAAKTVDRAVSGAAVKGIETGEKVVGTVKEKMPENEGEAKGQAKEAMGSAKGTANETMGQVKGKANELAGEAKGKAQELKGEAKARSP